MRTTTLLTTILLSILSVAALAPTGQAIVVCGDTQETLSSEAGVYVCVDDNPIRACAKFYIDVNGNHRYDSTDPQIGPGPCPT